MTDNQQKAFRGIMTEVLQDVLPRMFLEQEKKFDQKLEDLRLDIRDEIHSVVKASEAGLIRRMEDIEEKLTKRTDDGFSSVLELIDGGLIPQIQEHDRDMHLIKRHLKLA